MKIRRLANRLRHWIEATVFRIRSVWKEKFECPVCGYRGVFLSIQSSTGARKNARCASCGSLERHRIQFLVVDRILSEMDTANLKMLHFAPESFFRKYFSQRFGHYDSADLVMEDVDYQVDLQLLPFSDDSYDFVFASHVLEHIPDDDKAISEIHRILRPGGIAILPVPIVAEETVEYPQPNPHETYHVRAPGHDYFERYERIFLKVERFTSESFPEKYQLFLFEDRTRWPSQECPLRPKMEGDKHIDIVPICYV